MSHPEQHPARSRAGGPTKRLPSIRSCSGAAICPASEAAISLAPPEPPSWDPPTEDELAALDSMKGNGQWAVQGRELELTNLDKVLFPPGGVDRPGFWHKEVPGHAPEWLARWRNEETDPGETGWYAVLDSVPAL